MSLIYEPEYEENNSYTLKIEWVDVDANFTHYIDNQVTDVFNASDFCEFMNGYYENNIRLIDVNINQELYSELFLNIDTYIDYLNSYRDSFSINFLAISPNETQKLLIRTNELFLYPKFFEYWKIVPLTDHTSYDYISNLKHLKAQNFKNTTNWTFADYLFFTLVMKKVFIGNRFGFAHNPQLRKIIEQFKTENDDFCEYLFLAFTSQSINEWDDFCNSMLEWFNKEIASKATTSFNNEYVELKNCLKDVNLFFMDYADFQNQNDLFVGLPFDLLNRRLTINM